MITSVNHIPRPLDPPSRVTDHGRWYRSCCAVPRTEVSTGHIPPGEPELEQVREPHAPTQSQRRRANVLLG